MTSARDKILEAYADLLAIEGERHATLEATAGRAGVSKGGLLYHFPTKEHLSDALCDRLLTLAADDVHAMTSAPDGPARHYVRTSLYQGTPLDRTIVAVSRLQQVGNARARDAMEEVSTNWLAVLYDTLGDHATARAIKLIGDGLYYNALYKAVQGEPNSPENEDELLAVVDRISGMKNRRAK